MEAGVIRWWQCSHTIPFPDITIISESRNILYNFAHLVSSDLHCSSSEQDQSSGWLHARRTPELYPNSAGCLQHPSVIIIVLEPSITPKSPLVYDVYIEPKNSSSNSVAPLRVYTFLLSPCISLMCFLPWWPFDARLNFAIPVNERAVLEASQRSLAPYMHAQDIASLSWCWIVSCQKLSSPRNLVINFLLMQQGCYVTRGGPHQQISDL